MPLLTHGSSCLQSWDQVLSLQYIYKDILFARKFFWDLAMGAFIRVGFPFHLEIPGQLLKEIKVRCDGSDLFWN